VRVNCRQGGTADGRERSRPSWLQKSIARIRGRGGKKEEGAVGAPHQSGALRLPSEVKDLGEQEKMKEVRTWLILTKALLRITGRQSDPHSTVYEKSALAEERSKTGDAAPRRCLRGKELGNQNGKVGAVKKYKNA